MTSGWLKGQAAEREEVRGALRLGVGDVTGKPNAVPVLHLSWKNPAKPPGWGVGVEA